MTKHLSTVVSAAFLALSATAATVPDGYTPEIYASVYSTNSWKEHNFDEVGMYRFSADKYERQLVMQDPYIDASGGGALTDDFYFCTQEYNYGYWVDVTHYLFDPETWIMTESLRDGEQTAVATDMTYDPLTAKVFGCFYGDSDDGPMVFGTLNIATGERFGIADIDIPWIACSVDRSGNLYAVDMEGNLLAVDKVTGSTEKLGNLGFSATRRSTGAIDTRTGIFYVVVTNTATSDDPWIDYELNNSQLYAVDIAKATATHLYEFEDGEALGGMFIPGPAAPDGAPAAAVDLAVDFPDGALNGTVSFQIPTTTFDGNPASGSVSYLVRANGALLVQGTAAYGEKVTAKASIAESAMYKIELTLSNAAGRSPKTSCSLWLGPDTPRPISRPALSYADGCFTVSWEAPEGSEHGGYYNPDNISYKVVRYPDAVIVADNIRSTSVSDPVAIPTGLVAYRYEVTMVYGSTSFMPVSTDIWRLGSTPLPWSVTFENENALDNFTLIDVDGDKTEWYREWEFYIEDTDELIPVVVYPYSPSAHGADDWLITPPFKLEKSTDYTLTYSSLTDYLGDEPLMAVYIGNAPKPEAMTSIIQQPQTITSLLPENHSIKFSVDTDDLYYIGFYACSDAGKSAVALHSIALDADRSGISLTESTQTVKIGVNGHSITISATTPAQYSVYTPDGRRVACGNVASGETHTADLPSGLYIVKAGTATAKIAVP